jgi:thiol:disulfide interchange protein
MNTVLSALGLGFAAFAVWLVVRIVNRRERWAKRVAFGILVLALATYPFAWGPWLWFKLVHKPPYWAKCSGDAVFAPLRSLADCEMLPEPYRHHVNKWIAEAVNIKHGPKR